MNTVETWGGAVGSALMDAWLPVAEFFPKILGAVVILLIGMAIASFVEKIAIKILRLVKFDHLVRSTGVNDSLEKIGISQNITELIGKAVKWFFVIVAISAAIDILDINQLTILVNQFILYLPNVFVAFLIVILGLIGGRAAQALIRRAIGASRISDATGDLIASVAKWSVVVFSFMAALVQMKIADDLIKILFAGIVVMLALAGGLALGLGGREKIRQWIDKIQM